jgi:hypothetical protein
MKERDLFSSQFWRLKNPCLLMASCWQYSEMALGTTWQEAGSKHTWGSSGCSSSCEATSIESWGPVLTTLFHPNQLPGVPTCNVRVR